MGLSLLMACIIFPPFGILMLILFILSLAIEALPVFLGLMVLMLVLGGAECLLEKFHIIPNVWETIQITSVKDVIDKLESLDEEQLNNSFVYVKQEGCCETFYPLSEISYDKNSLSINSVIIHDVIDTKERPLTGRQLLNKLRDVSVNVTSNISCECSDFKVTTFSIKQGMPYDSYESSLYYGERKSFTMVFEKGRVYREIGWEHILEDIFGDGSDKSVQQDSLSKSESNQSPADDKEEIARRERVKKLTIEVNSEIARRERVSSEIETLHRIARNHCK